MDLVTRVIEEFCLDDLKKKMVFISGPRQVGKTTLAKNLLSRRGEGVYLNFDNADDRKRILNSRWPQGPGLVVLDEIHKYQRWKRFVKGEYDKHQGTLSFLVTGSARLDVYRKGGDSLQGRYHHWRLHPFTCAEILGRRNLPRPFEKLTIDSTIKNADVVNRLKQFGGFPEPYLRANERELRRWHKQRLEKVLKEDVRDLSNIHDISLIEILGGMLIERAGSLLSLNSLREDLEISHRTVSAWLKLFEILYYGYRIYPYSRNLVRALKKESKFYLWDWSMVASEGARFENMVAGHLLKMCHALEDFEGYDARLQYCRDREGREVDFIVMVNNKPWFCVEAKLTETTKNNIRYFMDRLGIPFGFCISAAQADAFEKDGVVYASAAQFLPVLGI
jgi:hypothetical protein